MADSTLPILVYDDAGADPFCVGCLLRALRETHGAAETFDAASLLAGGWQDRCAAIALPGGADRPYAAKLDGRGNAMIRRYVEGGGRFLGVCAGAYYACRRIDFAGGNFAVRAGRELGFFPGTAVGSLDRLAAPYRLRDLRCAAAVEVGGAAVLYWGGCRFDADAGAPPFDVLARYAALPTDQDVAAVRVKIGRGVAVLVGVHAEVRGQDFDRERRGYDDADAATATAAALADAEPGRRRLFGRLIAGLNSDAE